MSSWYYANDVGLLSKGAVLSSCEEGPVRFSDNRYAHKPVANAVLVQCQASRTAACIIVVR